MRKFIRFCLKTVFTVFKVRCSIEFDERNMPRKGVYVANHVSFLDPVLLFAFLPGDPVFALNGHLYRNRLIRFLMRTADVMPFNPIEPGDIKELIAKVDGGRLCVIFAEGRVTESGGLMKIYEAPGLVADKSGAPLIPVWIEGPQYGYFSKTKGKLPHRPLPKVRVIVGRPRSFKLKDELRRQRDHISNEVYMILREMSFEVRYNPDISLFAQLMKTAKIHAKKGLFRRPKFVEDIQRKPQSYRDIVIKSFVLGKYLKRRTEPEEHVGLFLPNSVAALCSFFGLTAYDRIPVMLNFSVGAQNMVSMCKTAQVRIVVTSLAFVKTAKMEDAVKMMEEAGVKIIYLEKAAKEIGLWDKINAYLRYKIKRVPIKKGGNRKAVILFTSGSEGTPKAVVLSHANIISNIKQMSAIETINVTDTVFNALPMFHSFGLVVGTLFPLFEGSKLFLYPSPLHYRVVAEIVYEIGASIMFGTDTFFRGYGRIAHPFDFHNIRFMFGGAEAVKPDTRNIWMERLGIRVLVPLEGGWYHTGDVVEIDEIGFVYIRDRIKRFAKIGGEMVSLNAVHEMVCKAYETDGEFQYGVVAIPHESKGEQIVLATNNRNVSQDGLHAYIRANAMSELFLPRIILYMEKLPVFATGKADNVTLKKIVLAETAK